MATQAFIATYKDRRGKEKSLKLKAADLASAKRSLRKRGIFCLLYTSPSPRDLSTSRMPSSA